MIITDDYGTWNEEKNGVRTLLEPTQKWIDENRTQTPQQKRDEILQALRDLDFICSREREDSYIRDPGYPMTQKHLDAIASKMELRNQLQLLESPV